VRETEIQHINQVIEEYFNKNSDIEEIPAKEMMPLFIEKGIFNKDHRNGLPIRNLLRELDRSKQLNKIPYALPRRKAKNTNWFFTRKTSFKDVQVIFQAEAESERSDKKVHSKDQSDEKYILDLCDEVLGLEGSRQHKFDFLKGDLHKNGKTRTKLPCDIYYASLSLVIEYNESQHFESNAHFDKPDVITVSGVHRGAQRKKYDDLRRSILPKYDIKVVEFFIDELNRKGKKIKRDIVKDKAVIKQKFIDNGYLKEK
jgi:hypothetical protein